MDITATAKEEFLAAPWLKELGESPRAAVLRELKEARVPAKTDLLIQGVQNDNLIFLVGGTVDVLWDCVGGEQQLVTSLEAPAVFGVPSFFRPISPSVTVRARTEARILTLDHASHERIRRQCPEAAEVLALAAIRVLADRFDLLDGRLCELMAQEAKRTSSKSTSAASEWAKFRAQLFEKATL